jgi:orsellinic acid C2-O-methyltransferase
MNEVEAHDSAPARRRQLLDAINASWTTQAIAAAVELRIPELLASAPLASEALARVAGCDTASLRRLLVALATLDLVEHDADGRCALTKSGALLRADVADSLAAWALFNGRHAARVWPRLAQSVQSGRSARTNSGGSDDFDHLDVDPAAADLFHRAMSELTRPIAAAFAAAVDLGRARLVVDVGGGYGRLIATLLIAYPEMHGVLFDLPHAIAAAAPQLARVGVAGRCDFVCGSFFEVVPAGADAYLLKSVLHDWDDGRSATILDACRRAMASSPVARLFVIERLAPERFGTTARDRAIARSDLNMLVSLGGRERTEAQYRAMLRHAGLEPGRTHALAAEFSAIEAVVADRDKEPSHGLER